MPTSVTSQPVITAFHLDEYAGVTADHPASFRRFLKEKLFDHVPIGCFHGLRGEAADLDAECARYAALLESERPGLVALGIGEDGHLAFIDPAGCDFDDPRDVRVVELGERCRSMCTTGRSPGWKMSRAARCR